MFTVSGGEIQRKAVRCHVIFVKLVSTNRPAKQSVMTVQKTVSSYIVKNSDRHHERLSVSSKFLEDRIRTGFNISMELIETDDGH